MLSQDGEVLRILPTDGPIRLLHWWGEHNLLLAGCADEKVIAFDPDTGVRKWAFTSEEDPAVFRAAKPYWFKTAPGHAGVHGLHSGVFLDGKSQAFVGSACTLEILDQGGNLVKRVPVFWGPGSRFALIDGPDGSIDLLIARQPTDSHAMAVVNNRELDPKQRSFRDVPEGHTNIGGWACMSRKHIFNEDLDGDGRREVVSEINGTWNRVTVWAEDGRALHNVHLGPGERIPADNVRDFDVFDLDGDGRKELLAALSGGLDTRPESPSAKGSGPGGCLLRLTVMAAVVAGGGARVVAGCEDGALVVLDSAGAGRPIGQDEREADLHTEGERNRCPGDGSGRDHAGGGSTAAGDPDAATEEEMETDKGSVGLKIDTLKPKCTWRRCWRRTAMPARRSSSGIHSAHERQAERIADKDRGGHGRPFDRGPRRRRAGFERTA